MSRAPELRALTAARGIAACYVVLFHIRLSIAGLPEAVRAVLGKGYLAVDFFFLLSGFVIALSWGSRLHDEGARAVPAFLRKRFARVWPLHAVMLGAAVALATILAMTGRPDPEFPFAALPLHVLLVQAWGSAPVLSWNDPAWSISAEFAAYLLFPLLAIMVDWRRVPHAAVIALAAAMLLGLHLAMRGVPTLGTDIARFGVVRCLFEFATGILLHALWQRSPRRTMAPAVLAVIALGGWAAGVAETLAVPAAFAGLLLVLAANHRALPGRALHYLGRISYATYLSHFLIWKVAKLARLTDTADVEWPRIGLYLMIVLIASAALHHWVERRAQAWIDGRFSPPLPPPALPPAPRGSRR